MQPVHVTFRLPLRLLLTNLTLCPCCREYARSIPGKSQVFVNAYAKALEVIPRQLCDNAGFDATDVLSRLRNKHSLSEDRGKHFGIDINTGAFLQAVDFMPNRYVQRAAGRLQP